MSNNVLTIALRQQMKKVLKDLLNRVLYCLMMVIFTKCLTSSGCENLSLYFKQEEMLPR